MHENYCILIQNALQLFSIPGVIHRDEVIAWRIWLNQLQQKHKIQQNVESVNTIWDALYTLFQLRQL